MRQLRTLSDLRDLLLTLPQVVEAELEGDEPIWLRIEVSDEEHIGYVIAWCLMLDWQARRRTDSRTLAIEDE